MWIIIAVVILAGIVFFATRVEAEEPAPPPPEPTPPPPLSGTIGPGLIWHTDIWHNIVSGMEIPLNKEVYITLSWLNTSGTNIIGHVELSVARPDGVKYILSATKNQDKEAKPKNGWAVQFAPFIALREGTYTLVATLSSGGKTLDSLTFTLITVSIPKPEPSVKAQFYMPPKITVVRGQTMDLLGTRFDFKCLITNKGNGKGTHTLTFIGYHNGIEHSKSIKTIALQPAETYNWTFMQWLRSGTYKVTLKGDWVGDNYSEVST